MKYRQSVLQRLQQQKLAELESTPNQGKFSFFTEKDTNNSQVRELVTAELVTYQELEAALHQIHCFNAKVGIDLETTRVEHWMPDSEVIGVGFTIPLVDTKLTYTKILGYRYYFITEDLEKVAEVIEKYNPWITWVGHNLKFDMLWLLNHYDVMLKRVEDTMVMCHILTVGTGHPLRLDKLAQEYLGRYPYTLEEITGKSKKEICPEVMKSIPLQVLGDYCCEDTYEAVLLEQYFSEQLTKPDNEKLQHLYHTVDKQCIHALVWMEYEGIRVNLNRLEEIMLDVSLEQETIQDEARAHAGGVDINSPKQLSSFLYETLQLPTKGIKKGKQGFYSTDKESLSKNAGMHSIVDLLLEYRKLAKLSSSFLKPLPKLERCHRIHPTFNNCRTVTGRLSCDCPNLQQIPNPAKSVIGKEIRKLYVASPGYAIIRADYSQMELRILTHLSQDPYLLECYRKNLDMHVVVTELVFDIKYDANDPLHKKLRTLCKTLNFGLIYGMSALRLYAECLKIALERSIRWCEEMLEKYWSIFTGVRDWMFGQAYVGTIERGYTETLHGRRRYFEFKHPYLRAMKGTGMDYTYENYRKLEKKGVLSDPHDLECLRAAGNAPVQGGNADACRIAAACIYEKFAPFNEIIITNYNSKSGGKLLLLVHDEVVAEAPQEICMSVRDTIVEIMEQAYPLSIPTKVSSSISDSWGTAD